MASQYLIAAPLTKLFTDPKQFKSIFFGSIYIGNVDEDPLNPSQQQQVYVVDESNVKTPVSQPIQIGSGGYAEYNGHPAKFVCDDPYSIVVLDRLNAEKWRVPDIRSVDLQNVTHNDLSGRDDVGAHDNIYRRQATVAEIESGVFETGSLLTIPERANANVDVVPGGAPDGYSIINAGNGNTAVLIPDENGVSPSHLGATRSTSGQSDSIQAWDDYCSSNGLNATGNGLYYLEKTVRLSANISSIGGLFFSPSSNFLDSVSDPIPVDLDNEERRVVILDGQNSKIHNVIVTNLESIPDLVGMDYSANQIKSYDSGARAFRVNNLVRSFSIKITNGRGTSGGVSGKGLVAYAPNFLNEINALVIDGGEWFGNQSGSIDIGDRDGLFTTDLSPSDYMGNSVKISNFPTLDGGFLSVDQIIDFEGEVYFENAGTGGEEAAKVGGKADNSVRGFKLSGYARDYDYYVKCYSAVSGINMQSCFSRAITKSALYLTSDQFAYTYSNNTSISSFADGQEVHTGVRAGRSDNFWRNATVDVYGLQNGLASGSSINDHVYPNQHERADADTLKYRISRYRYYKSSPAAANGSVSGNIFTFDIKSESSAYNGGDAVNLGSGLTYILAVDYINGTANLDNAGTTGSATMSQQAAPAAFYEGYAFEQPTLTTVSEGSITWNMFTVSQTPDGWIRKAAGWTPMS